MPVFSFDAGSLNFEKEDKLSDIESYLFMLTEQLRYTLSNLDKSNVNSAAAEEFALSISRPIEVRLEDSLGLIRSELEVSAASLLSRIEISEKEFSSLKQTVDSITFEVTNNGTSSVISLERDGVSIKAQAIELTGYVRFQDLSGAGNTAINGSNITTGTIKGVTYYASGLGESFVVTDPNYARSIGGIRYEFVDPDMLYADKMYLYTSSYFDGYSTWYPSIKIESAGNISVEAPAGLIYMKAGEYVTLSCSGALTFYVTHYVNYNPVVTTWEFAGGSLYKNGAAVL